VCVLGVILLTPSQRERWFEWAETLTNMFTDSDALPVLANSLTLTIRVLFFKGITDSLAQEWLEAWEKSVQDQPQMDVALRLLRAAVEWKRTRDRGALLRLAAEERTVLEELLPRE
jgi:hypothetical protein